MKDSGHFLLVGNASYDNRGCEAIVRGTMEILRNEFGDQVQATVASYMSPETARAQSARETDARIRHVRLTVERFEPAWWLDQANRRWGLRTPGLHLHIAGPLGKARAALAIGGDNYSLDYGRPTAFLAMDRYILRRSKPLVIWGASVGPFDQDPEFDVEAQAHLLRLAGIFARESFTVDYLNRNGLTRNVHLVSDPAFAMRPVQPPDQVCEEIRPGTVGLNFSPLMSRYAGGAQRWMEVCVMTVETLVRTLDHELLLIPHVMIRGGGVNDDPSFLREVAGRVEASTGRRIPVLSDELTAAELKWAIGRLHAFAGARTHATIAAMSSCVPTLSLSYSVKSRGINHDIYGSQEFCLPPEEMTAERLPEAVRSLAARGAEVRRRLQGRIPGIVQRAFHAGKLLRDVVSGHS